MVVVNISCLKLNTCSYAPDMRHEISDRFFIYPAVAGIFPAVSNLCCPVQDMAVEKTIVTKDLPICKNTLDRFKSTNGGTMYTLYCSPLVHYYDGQYGLTKTAFERRRNHFTGCLWLFH